MWRPVRPFERAPPIARGKKRLRATYLVVNPQKKVTSKGSLVLFSPCRGRGKFPAFRFILAPCQLCMDPRAPIVIDCGSYHCRAGFAGARCSAFSPSIGRPRQGKGLGLATGRENAYIGEEMAIINPRTLVWRAPVEDGVIVNWDDMEKVWHHVFYNEVRANPEEHPILLAECTFNPRSVREKTAMTMFETFNAPSMHLANSAALSLLALGRRTGLVVDCGYSSTRYVPVYEGHALAHCARKDYFGGSNITDYLIKELCKREICAVLSERTHSQSYLSLLPEELARSVRSQLGVCVCVCDLFAFVLAVVLFVSNMVRFSHPAWETAFVS